MPPTIAPPLQSAPVPFAEMSEVTIADHTDLIMLHRVGQNQNHLAYEFKLNKIVYLGFFYYNFGFTELVNNNVYRPVFHKPLSFFRRSGKKERVQTNRSRRHFGRHMTTLNTAYDVT